MSNVISFSKARKAKARTEAKAQAAENRVKFGRTKGDKAKTASEADKARRDLDGAKIED
jgi:hypothetical protein